MKKRYLWTIVLLLAACTQAPIPIMPLSPTPPPTILRIGVSDSATAVIDLLEPIYTLENPNTIVQFVVANSSTLMADLQKGQLDAILDHTPPDGSAYWTNPIALDGLVAIVHASNPVNTLTQSDLQGIFTGRLTNWSTVGGQDMPVTLISPPRGSGSFSIFATRVMQAQRINVNTQIPPTDAALQQVIATTESAIGLSMMGNHQDANVKLIRIEDHLPTPEETAVQSYPLTVPLYFIHASSDEPTGDLRAWLAWVQSAEGQALLGERYGRVR